MEWRRDRNEERKYARDHWRYRRVDDDRRYARDHWRYRRDDDNRRYVYNPYVYNRYYSDNDRYYYSDDDRYYGGGSNWTQQLLGGILSSFLGGQTGGNYYNFVPQYDQYYGNNVYLYDRGSQYYYYNQPQYNAYQAPYAYSNYIYPSYIGSPQYDAYGGLADGLFGQIPYFDIADQYTGGFATQMLQQALNYGYERGFLAGQAARYKGVGDDYYYDPYAYENAGYDDGYSLSLDQNRQYLSEGYRLGYMDALNGQNEYDPQPNGEVDLVGTLLNGVLSSGIL